MNKKLKNYGKFALKVGLTTLALYFVFRKIDFTALKSSILTTKLGYFFLAFLTFNLSKIVAAFRLNLFYRAIGVSLSSLYNIKLYYLGMFYNLFLPGSVGGDGYKVFLLKQKFKEVRTKKLVWATLLDRVNGLVCLVFIAGGLLLALKDQLNIPFLFLGTTVAMVLIFPLFYVGMRLFFVDYLKHFLTITGLSFVVQLGQLLFAWFLLLALSVPEGYIEYLTTFMVAAVVSVLPITVGGVGAREGVFLFFAPYLGLNEEVSIAFTLLIFGIMALTALIGVVFSYRLEKKEPM